jgi:GDP-L-fucose synthase
MNILLLGASGLIGSAIARFKNSGHNLQAPGRSTLNVEDLNALKDFLSVNRTDVLINAAGVAAGIQGNIEDPTNLMLANSKIINVVMEASHEFNIPKVLNFASACIYPVASMNDSRAEDIGTGPIEITSEKYAYAKLYGIKLLESYRMQYGHNWSTIIPSNIYGPNDWTHGTNGHVIAMLVDKFFNAIEKNLEEVSLWGTGQARRSFLHVDDLAKAVWMLVESRDEFHSVLNVSSEEEITIKELAELLARKVGFEGKILFDSERPEGVLRKRLNDGAIRGTGWQPQITMEMGIDKYLRSRLDSKGHD